MCPSSRMVMDRDPFRRNRAHRSSTAETSRSGGSVAISRVIPTRASGFLRTWSAKDARDESAALAASRTCCFGAGATGSLVLCGSGSGSGRCLAGLGGFTGL
uniref:Uncharacterized protein n=1 Tax=Arundo donax TaxID=35708 RepID=A0A0A9DNV2_ARUDO